MKKNDLNKIKAKIHSVIHLAAINGTEFLINQNWFQKLDKGIINILDC